MPVRVVTDSSANLPADIVEELDITIAPLHVMSRSGVASTAGLTALELTAVYARQLERGHDDGVLALHLSKELSSTWTNAVTASAVFDDSVRVIDTNSAGMGLGAAAMAAAKLASRGASLGECYEAAVDTLERSELYVYLHRIDDLRRSGRLSPATALMSSALATRPIMMLKNGKLELAAKTRTQTKAFIKLVEIIAERAAGQPVFVAIQQHEAREAARHLQTTMEAVLASGSSYLTTDIDPVLSVHLGPGSIAVSVVYSQSPDAELSTAK
ncbi:DegV family protein [Corynebacterium epidermidicanis]|uniref:EDD domain protein, DegV family n=1 Tax=Corynebacterium epidermidicanis TaxID=1050174 RepID=A0A0G3GW76_9CORY|nr:DegV family protein [Corynebacterium epidermidicanis]AKK03768.1 EDD domain protein, DegV family [Corynebacterium epidermidicanis]